MLKKHFTKANPLSRIFNKNTTKLSYTCTGNMKSIISSHNKQLTPKNKQVGCNCPTSQLIYQAENTNNLDDKTCRSNFQKTM